MLKIKKNWKATYTNLKVCGNKNTKGHNQEIQNQLRLSIYPRRR
jgi:hypothetical protein